MQYTVQSFITDLEVAFPRFGKQDEVAARRWAELVSRKLSGFKGDVLKSACEDIITTRKAKSFPALAEMITACDKWQPRADPREVAEAEAKAESWTVVGNDIGEAFWTKSVADKPRSPIFAEAARGGWHMCLKSFMVNKRRLPNQAEALDCQAEARMFLEAYEDCVRGGFPNAARFENLGDAMLKAREHWRCRILGEPTEAL
jgi:hypothetical protein